MIIIAAIVVSGCAAKRPTIGGTDISSVPAQHVCGTAQPEYTGPDTFVPFQKLNIGSDVVHYVNPKGAINGRVLMFNGVGTFPEAYLMSPYQNLATDFLTNGYQMILVMIDSSIDPLCFIDFFHDDGSQYALYWKNRVSNILSTFDKMSGPVKTTLVGGFSLGGIHALMAVELLPGRFDGFFAYEPVVHLNAVLEFSALNTPKFDTYFDLNTLAKPIGYIAWGTLDHRVNWTLDKQLYEDLKTLNADVHGKEWSGIEHEAHQEQIDDIQKWFDSKFGNENE